MNKNELSVYERTYRASELIALLNELVSKHGDLPVVAKDADTDWRLEIGLTYCEARAVEEWPDHFVIRTEYHSRPEGAKT